MKKTALVTHEECLQHVTPPGHPEQVARLEYILEALKTSTTFKYNLNKDINTSSEATCNSKTKACCNKTKENEKKSFIQRLFGF